MEFETFRGKDVGEAMAAVRAAFGQDAWIGPTRFLTNGQSGGLNHQVVEIKAAPGVPPDGRTSPLTMNLGSNSHSLNGPPPVRRRGTMLRGPTQDVGGLEAINESLRAQLASIRQLLEELHAAQNPKDRAKSILHAARIEGRVAARLVRGATAVAKHGDDALRDWIRNRIAKELRILDSPIRQTGPRVILCVGPTGVGKTTTVAKLAAQAHLDLGRSVSVMTLDTYRVGSVEQLGRFAKLIGVPFSLANTVDAFKKALGAHRTDLTFVDTASLPPTDEKSLAHVLACLACVSDTPVDVLLTIPASIQGYDAERQAMMYKKLNPTGLVITKLDEASRAGGIIHAALGGNLPVAYISDGPRVPEDLRPATTQAVIEAVFANRS